MSNQLSAALGVVRATVQITRKATGKVEEYKLEMPVRDDETHEQLMQQQKEQDNGTHA